MSNSAVSALRAAAAQLAPTGVLRAGVNMSNFLLVNGTSSAGKLQGVAPDLASAIASRLGVGVDVRGFAHPELLCDAAADKAWDICCVGADPGRASLIDFTDAYCEIEATFMVPIDSHLVSQSDVDQKDIRIASKRDGAYDLWLQRNFKHAKLCQVDTLDASFELFRAERLEALAGLRPKLVSDLQKAPSSYRILDGQFMSVQQAVGCLKEKEGRSHGIDFLRKFVEESISSGLVEDLIAKHGVTGRLSVAQRVP